MLKMNFGGFYKCVFFELFYINLWFDCFCQMNLKKVSDKCLLDNVVEIFESWLESVGDLDLIFQMNFMVVGLEW